MKRILLIALLENEHRHLGCLSLFSFLKKNGFKVELLYIPNKMVFKEDAFLYFCKSKAIELIGFSVMTKDFYFVANLTDTIHKKLSPLKVLWG